ncbi:hypothetical protein ACH9L7_19710 (plasmid) [Haloferax sp. S1W]|uniref:hypothetical protein n=1 Tax=Haloferax sp. S1W TaxID=3377110 RepID=UPI0037CC75CE
MHLEKIPFVGPLLAAGADDAVFDILLLLGPLVIVLITILGRTSLTVLLAVAYTSVFVGYIAYKSMATTESKT